MIRYLAILAAALLVPILAVMAMNLTSDPFLYFWPRSVHLPEPAYTAFDRETHYNLIIHTRPRAVFLGSSQVQLAMRAQDWAVPGPVINTAAVGEDISEMRRAFELAQKQGPVDAAIIGLDYSQIKRNAPNRVAAFDGYILNSDGSFTYGNFKSLFSFAMLKISLQKAWQHYITHVDYYAADGHALDQVYVQAIGFVGTAQRAIQHRLGQFSESLIREEGPFFTEVRALRDDACQGKTHLIAFLTPLHAVTIEAIHEAGQAAAWENWKRQLVALSAERPQCRFEIWDFDAYNAVTTEPLPQDGAGLVNSWDGVHFKANVGKQILNTITGQSKAPLGMELRSETLEAQLAFERDTRLAYIASHQDEHARWLALLQQSKQPASH